MQRKSLQGSQTSYTLSHQIQGDSVWRQIPPDQKDVWSFRKHCCNHSPDAGWTSTLGWFAARKMETADTTRMQRHYDHSSLTLDWISNSCDAGTLEGSNPSILISRWIRFSNIQLCNSYDSHSHILFVWLELAGVGFLCLCFFQLHLDCLASSAMRRANIKQLPATTVIIKTDMKVIPNVIKVNAPTGFLSLSQTQTNLTSWLLGIGHYICQIFCCSAHIYKQYCAWNHSWEDKN
jgi:hypothetical protein